MKLVHNSAFTGTVSKKKRYPLRIQCESGSEMQSTMLKVARYCKNQKSSSTVLWDSQHHEVILWFEEEKYITYFNLKGINSLKE